MGPARTLSHGPTARESAILSSLELRPRLATEIVDAAFQLYRRHFSALVTLSAVVFAPYVLLELLLTGGQSNMNSSPAAVAALSVVGWIFGSLSEAAIVLAVSNSYLRNEPDPAGSLRRTARRLGSIMLVISAKWLAIGLGLVLGLAAGMIGAGTLIALSGLLGLGTFGVILSALLIVVATVLGGLLSLHYFALFFAIPATLVLEGTGVGASLRRSRALAQGFKRKILGALGLPTLVFFVLQFIIVAMVELLPGPRLLTTLGWQAVNVVASPILSVIATLLYYDARIRKEGFDIEIMAAELGSESSTPAQPSLPTS
jgi:hypothetical protein